MLRTRQGPGPRGSERVQMISMAAMPVGDDHGRNRPEEQLRPLEQEGTHSAVLSGIEQSTSDHHGKERRKRVWGRRSQPQPVQQPGPRTSRRNSRAARFQGGVFAIVVSERDVDRPARWGRTVASHRISHPASRIPDPGCRIPDPGSRIPDPSLPCRKD